MIELIQFPWSPFCLVQRRILEYSGVAFKTIDIPPSDRSLVWRLSRQRYYGVPIIRDGRTVVFETDDFSQIIAKYLDGKLQLNLFPKTWQGIDRMVWRNIEDQIEGPCFRLNDIYFEEMVPPDSLLDSARKLINAEISARSLDIILRVKDRFLEVLNTTGDVLVGQELVPAAVLRSRQINDFRDEVSILKDFGDIRVEAKIITRSEGVFTLSVLIKNMQTLQVIKDLRVSLIKGETELESYLSESGKVVFEHVLFGKYTVEISATSERMASLSIDIKV